MSSFFSLKGGRDNGNREIERETWIESKREAMIIEVMAVITMHRMAMMCWSG